MVFDLKQAGLSELEQKWLGTFLPGGTFKNEGELFDRIIKKSSDDLHASKKKCLANIQRIFTVAQKLRTVEKSQMQEIWFEPACQMIEGLCLAVEGCALKKADRKEVPKGTTLTSVIQQADVKLKKGDEEGAKKIFSLLARNVLLKKDRIAPFEDLDLSDDIDLRLRNWATALKLLTSDYRRK